MLPTWLYSLPLHLISEIANEQGVDPDLVAAIVQTESSGKPCSTRFEPKFRWFNEPKKWARMHRITKATEKAHQRTSWGLMHIMGATARDAGFSGFMPELCSPQVGLEYGVKYLVSRIRLYGTRDIERLYAAYNAGKPRKSLLPGKRFKNQGNVDNFMRYYREIKGDS